MKVVSLVPVPPEDAARIHALAADVELVDAAGWFDGEYAQTWPAATVRRYVPGSGQGTRAERDALLRDADVLIIGFPFPLDLCARAPRLAWVHTRPAGASNLERGDIWGAPLTVTTSRGYGEVRAIAEYAIAGICHFAKALDVAVADRRDGVFDFRRHDVRGLAEHTLCVVGAGGIGREIGRLAHGLGIRVTGLRRNTERTPDDEPFAELGTPDTLHAALGASDFVVVSCQWTPETTDLLDAPAFAAMRPGAIVVNVARGEIVDEAALLAALDSGQVRGAVLDVYVGEFDAPPPPALWHHPRVIMTPHTSNRTDSSQRRDMELFAANLERFLRGDTLENIIDWRRGY